MVSKLTFLVLVVLFVCACPKDSGDRGNHAAPDLAPNAALANRLYPMPNLAPTTAAERRLHVLALVRRGCYLGHNPTMSADRVLRRGDRVLRRGDRVRIRHVLEEAQGQVVLASANGRSLLLSFEGVLGSFVGAMPVYRESDEAPYRDLVKRFEVELQLLQEGINGPA